MGNLCSFPVPTDTTGDGKKNAIGYDTTGDGVANALDTNLDGKIDALGRDTTGDGKARLHVFFIHRLRDR